MDTNNVSKQGLGNECLNTAAEIANQAAGIKVGKLGTSAVTREELERDLD